jgi:predicted nucleotidyltransferase
MFPPEIETQIAQVSARFQEILGKNLIGIYLHGSLAMGCFNFRKSDIDLLVLSSRTLTPRIRAALARTLLCPSNSPAPIEISVIKRADLRPWRHPCPYDFHYSEDWRTRFEQFLADPAHTWAAPETGDEDLAAHITVLRARGQSLYGPPIATAFPEIPRSDYLDSVLGDVLSPEFGLTSATASPVYMILNACRTLAYLETGQIFSKAEGGAWPLENLPAAQCAIVQAALSAYRDNAEMAVLELGKFQEWALKEIGRKVHLSSKTSETGKLRDKYPSN